MTQKVIGSLGSSTRLLQIHGPPFHIGPSFLCLEPHRVALACQEKKRLCTDGTLMGSGSDSALALRIPVTGVFGKM